MGIFQVDICLHEMDIICYGKNVMFNMHGV